jgi:hypothetical protein
MYAPSVAEYGELVELGAVPLDPRPLDDGGVEIRARRGQLLHSRVLPQKPSYEDVRAAWRELLAELRGAAPG